MREVAIIGIGQTPVGEHWERSLRHLAHDAVKEALRDAGVERPDALYVGNMLSGELAGQEHLGALIADFAGLRGIEAIKVEAACGSGAAALRVGYMAVAGGLHDFVACIGVEKMTDQQSGTVTSALDTVADADAEAQPSAGKHVERGSLFGDERSLSLREDENAGREAEPRGRRRHETEEDKRLVKWMAIGVRPMPAAGTLGIGAEHMIVSQHMGVAERFSRLRVVPNRSRIVAKLRLREYNADLHRPRPSSEDDSDEGNSGAPCRIRTYDPLLRRQLRCPLR